jgi:LysM repeat protein
MPTYYTAVIGDTLGKIAIAHHMPLATIIAFNPSLHDAAHNYGEILHAGEKVRIG